VEGAGRHGQIWRVDIPAGVRRLSIEAWGAGGGSSRGPTRDGVDGFLGGNGGYAWTEVDVSEGDTLWVVAGGGGVRGGHRGPAAFAFAPDSAGGGGAGGAAMRTDAPPYGTELPLDVFPLMDCATAGPDFDEACPGSGAGGGFSGVFLSRIAQDDALLVAGGGGGGGVHGDGGHAGADGRCHSELYGAHAGGGATADGPGWGGQARVGWPADAFGGWGDALQGGSGAHESAEGYLPSGPSRFFGGGGGGGGWFGGGGGSAHEVDAWGCGGGGGSSYAPGGQLDDLSSEQARRRRPSEEVGMGGSAGPGGPGAVTLRW
jgi:hypothetical protein